MKTGDKQESESIGNQRKIIERYAKENNLTLVQEYVDDGVSGTTFNRHGFNQMIEDIKAGKIDMVLTKDLSRLGREYIQTGFYIENFFPENNVRYVSILDGIDTFLDSTNNDITPFKAILNDMCNLYINNKVKYVDRFKDAVMNSDDFRLVFLGDIENFDYSKFDIEWLKQFRGGLIKEIARNEVARVNISRKFAERMECGEISRQLLKLYFKYFIE